MRHLLPVHHHQISRQDAKAQHRLPAHAQGKILLVVSAGVKGQIILDALLRQDRAARRDVAEDRHLTARELTLLAGGNAHRRGFGCGRSVLLERNGAALAGALVDQPELLQVLDVEMHRRRGLEPQRLSDLAHGGGISLLPDGTHDKIIDLLLHFGQLFHRPRSSQSGRSLLKLIISHRFAKCNICLILFYDFSFWFSENTSATSLIVM